MLLLPQAAPPLHTQGSSGLYNTRAEVPQAPVQTSDATRARGMPMSPPEPSPLRPQLPPPGAPHALMTARSMDRRDSEEEGEGAAAVQMAPHEPGKPETPQVQVRAAGRPRAQPWVPPAGVPGVSRGPLF